MYLPTYTAQIRRFIKRVRNEEHSDSRLNDTSPEEQMTHFLALKEVDENLFYHHLLLIDETIDPYLIFYFEKEGQVFLVWKCWDNNNCNADHELETVYRVTIEKQYLIDTLNSLIEFLDK